MPSMSVAGGFLIVGMAGVGIWFFIANILRRVFFKREFLQDVVKLATPIVEDVAHIDLNGDGIVNHTRQEIWEIAKNGAVKWGKEVVKEVLDALVGNELRRYLASARTAVACEAKKLPYSDSDINLAVELAYKDYALRVEEEKPNYA